MAARSVWKGFIRFSLVSVPVKAYTAAASGAGGISLNQLHRDCNTRIQYKKVCPVHGELTADQIVSGYQFAEGQYVVIEPEEIEKARSPKDKAIDIAAFIASDQIDPAYFSGKTHYLLPDGPMGMKPYALLHRTMVESDKCAFAQVVWHGRDQIVLLRPAENLLAMSGLLYSADVRKATEFSGEAPKIDVSPEELKLAKSLTDTLSENEFDFEKYRDHYTDNLQKVIEAKVSGKEVVEQSEEEVAPINNLMEALQKSLAAAKKAAPATKGKPPKLVAPSTTQEKPAAAKKRKSS